ncbi:MAG: Flp family type IVb pilin [Gammaproteobacteria bacterium]|nr:MAG: Flp family type IVb pilin [Gammaproteobacteria bacterium]
MRCPTMKQAIYRFLADESGLTTVEYAIAGALVSVAVIVAFTALGGQVATTIGLITTAITP